VPSAEAASLLPRLRGALAALLMCFQYVVPEPVLKWLRAGMHTHSTLPDFYLLPKLHKLLAVDVAHLPHLTARPIVASHSWVTTPVSTWLADVLNTACAARYPQVLPDSRALITLLESTTVSRNSFLVTFDVESMYPSIDVPLAAEACARAVGGRMSGVVHELLLFVMTNNYFSLGSDVYEQIHGGAMGTPCMPPVANIHMAYWVEARVHAAATYWPRIYKRFIDDGFLVWEQDRASLDAFLLAIGSALPTINITWHVSTTSIAYMDLVITKDLTVSGATVPLVIGTYQKPHNRYLYIPRVSFHRPHVFSGFVRGELIRYAVTNTRAEGFARMQRLFMQRLLDRGYPKAWLDRVFATVSHADRGAHLQAPGRRRRAAAQSQPPVFVSANGPYEMRVSLSAVINSVYQPHAHQHHAVRAALGGVDRVTVAFTAGRSIGAQLVRARL
jgi:hypothetical protein